jgi:hypothetical protein
MIFTTYHLTPKIKVLKGRKISGMGNAHPWGAENPRDV